MSYLIDALKKAERERHASQNPSLHAASTTDASSRSRRPQGLIIAALVALLIINGALVYRMWSPTPYAADTTDGAPEQTPPEGARPLSGQSVTAVPTMGDSGSSEDQVSGRALDRLQLSDKKASTTQEQEPAPRAVERPSLRINADEDRQGSVRYSSTPLDAEDDAGNDMASEPAEPGESAPEAGDSQSTSEDLAPDDTADNLPNQSQISGVPTVEINGQLYSSVPGRSFILIKGQRFHEGERLPQGPAIESITPDGATLRYRGQRYHVSGP